MTRNSPPRSIVNIQRKRAGQTVNYRVTDSPGELRPEDWSRVVAVFVAGPEWQFSDWPDVRAGQRPVDLFTKCTFRGWGSSLLHLLKHANACAL